MDLYISFKADGLESYMQRLISDDMPDTVRQQSQAFDRGSELWKSFAIRVGGSTIFLSSGEGQVMVLVGRVDGLKSLWKEYAACVGMPVSIGVGMKL